jgi:hypothetical protein
MKSWVKDVDAHVVWAAVYAAWIVKFTASEDVEPHVAKKAAEAADSATNEFVEMVEKET